MSQCDHRTAVTIKRETPTTPYRVLLCTWGCQEYLVSVDLADGTTATWAVSELVEVALEYPECLR